jgi:hypothetical protein
MCVHLFVYSLEGRYSVLGRARAMLVRALLCIVHIGDDSFSSETVIYQIRSIGSLPTLLLLSSFSATHHDTGNKHNPVQLPLASTREPRRELPLDPKRLSALGANVASDGSG